MRKRNYGLIMLLISSAVMLTCSDDDKKGTDPTPEPPGNNELKVDYLGGLTEVNINVDGEWYAEAKDNWVQLSHTAGKGKQPLQINAVVNRTDKDRTSTVNIYAGQATKAGQTKSNGNPVQTFVVSQQKVAAGTEIGPHFTDAKIEDGFVRVKFWSGKGGNILDVEESPFSFYPFGGLTLVERIGPEMETDWTKLYLKKSENIDKGSKLSIGDVAMLNSVMIAQDQTIKLVNQSALNSTGTVNFQLNGVIYYGGGYSYRFTRTTNVLGTPVVEIDNTPEYGFQSYNTAANKFTKLKDLPFDEGMAFIYQGVPYALTVDNPVKCTIYKYDVKSDSWTLFQELATQEMIYSAYSIGDKLYLLGETTRFEYSFSLALFALVKETPHDINIRYSSYGNILRTVSDLDGSVWVQYDNAVYKHTDNGYNNLSYLLGGHILGAHKGEVYVYNPNQDYKFKKIDKSGNYTDMELMFNFSATGFFDARKNALNVNGALYVFAGSKTESPPNMNPFQSVDRPDNNIYRFNPDMYVPAKVMLVTDK